MVLLKKKNTVKLLYLGWFVRATLRKLSVEHHLVVTGPLHAARQRGGRLPRGEVVQGNK